MRNLIVFGVIGLLTGGAARLAYPDRRSMHVLGTLLIGIIGAMIGGMISWSWWPAMDNEFRTGNLILAFIGAVIAIALGAGIAYKRSLTGYRKP